MICGSEIKDLAKVLTRCNSVVLIVCCHVLSLCSVLPQSSSLMNDIEEMSKLDEELDRQNDARVDRRDPNLTGGHKTKQKRAQHKEWEQGQLDFEIDIDFSEVGSYAASRIPPKTSQTRLRKVPSVTPCLVLLVLLSTRVVQPARTRQKLKLDHCHQ